MIPPRASADNAPSSFSSFLFSFLNPPSSTPPPPAPPSPCVDVFTVGCGIVADIPGI